MVASECSAFALGLFSAIINGQPPLHFQSFVPVSFGFPSSFYNFFSLFDSVWMLFVGVVDAYVGYLEYFSMMYSLVG